MDSRPWGFLLTCPVCQRPILPHDGLLHLALAPRLAHHMFEVHPYEANIIRLHLMNPPAEWPMVEGST